MHHTTEDALDQNLVMEPMETSAISQASNVNQIITDTSSTEDPPTDGADSTSDLSMVDSQSVLAQDCEFSPTINIPSGEADGEPWGQQMRAKQPRQTDPSHDTGEHGQSGNVQLSNTSLQHNASTSKSSSGKDAETEDEEMQKMADVMRQQKETIEELQRQLAQRNEPRSGPTREEYEELQGELARVRAQMQQLQRNESLLRDERDRSAANIHPKIKHLRFW